MMDLNQANTQSTDHWWRIYIVLVIATVGISGFIWGVSSPVFLMLSVPAMASVLVVNGIRTRKSQASYHLSFSQSQYNGARLVVGLPPKVRRRGVIEIGFVCAFGPAYLLAMSTDSLFFAAIFLFLIVAIIHAIATCLTMLNTAILENERLTFHSPFTGTVSFALAQVRSVERKASWISKLRWDFKGDCMVIRYANEDVPDHISELEVHLLASVPRERLFAALQAQTEQE